MHFGRVDVRVVAPLISALHEASPDLTVVSGDFVQNGTRREFEEAGEFVRQLPKPWLAVPGNHDLPFANLWKRFTTGLSLYREYITEDLEPYHLDDEIVVLGINTARLWPIRGGRINEDQVRLVEEKVCSLSGNLTKILVTHHPFDLAGEYHRRELVGRARMAMGRLAQSIDLLLAGHMHMSHAGETGVRYRLKGRSAIFVQAGTATSTRGRGEPNAFNLIRIDRPRISIERHQWNQDEQRFVCICTDKFTMDHEVPICLPEDELKAAQPEEVKAD